MQVIFQSHPSAQLQDSIEYMGADSPVKDAFKISSNWNMITPEGYSVLFLDPFMFSNKYFACWQGVIDSDHSILIWIMHKLFFIQRLIIRLQ